MTTVTTEIKDKMGRLDDEISEIKQKLAKCRREACEKDHDTLLVIQTEQKTMDKKLEDYVEITDETTNLTKQLAGNVNQLTDKIADIVKTDNSRKHYIYTIISGVLITLISAAIIWFASMSVSNMMKMNNEGINKLQKVIEEVQTEVKESRDEGLKRDVKIKESRDEGLERGIKENDFIKKELKSEDKK